jgi:tetratricopeptide (TPR) repeat protein
MPPLFADPFVRFDAQLDDRYSLLDWAPTILLKSATAPPSERWWWLAAMASIQGQADSSQALKHGEALVRLAEARFPDERRFLFEQGLFEDEQANPALIAFPGAVPGLSPLPAGLAAVEDAAGRVDIKIAGSSPDAFPSDPKDFRFHIRAAARAFSQVLDDQALAPESHLHLGSIEMRIDDPGRAVAHLERAAETLSVRDLRYVALLFLAAARARLSDTDHAEAALREAAVLAPGSDSTARMLAWLYVSTGRPAEASELMRKQLSSPAVWDPLLAYEGGDRFRWFEFIGQLRKGLRE